MKREERKEENNNLKDWKKPELKVLDKSGTNSGETPDYPEDFATAPLGS
jgi:hypothetical protein